MPKLLRVLLPLAFVAAPAPAFAQGDPARKDFFEGKSVRVKIDMPATQQGIDVYADARRLINFDQYIYTRDDQRFTAEFADGVLLPHAMTSR